jgi:uncharacterized protein (DUF1697 family)
VRTAILLRAVNVGGNKVAMSDLRKLLQDNGYQDVATFLQSGNALVSGKVDARKLEKLLEQGLGLKIEVLLRDHAQLEKIVAANPFPEHAGEGSKLNVAFCDRPPTGEPLPSGDEQFVIKGKEVYLWFPDGLGRSKMFTTLPKRLGVTCTVRTWKSVLKLAELTGTLGR